MSDCNLTKVTKYIGEHKGVNFEIHEQEASSYHNEMGHDKLWTHYIYLRLDKQIPDKSIADKFWLKPQHERGMVFYDYYNSIISELEFHGGCTWYSKESNPDKLERIIKVGCDYQHSWDEGKSYSLDYILSECINTIESLLKITPIKKRCCWCGQFDLSENFNGARCSLCDGGKSTR